MWENLKRFISSDPFGKILSDACFSFLATLILTSITWGIIWIIGGTEFDEFGAYLLVILFPVTGLLIFGPLVALIGYGFLKSRIGFVFGPIMCVLAFVACARGLIEIDSYRITDWLNQPKFAASGQHEVVEFVGRDECDYVCKNIIEKSRYAVAYKDLSGKLTLYQRLEASDCFSPANQEKRATFIREERRGLCGTRSVVDSLTSARSFRLSLGYRTSSRFPDVPNTFKGRLFEESELIAGHKQLIDRSVSGYVRLPLPEIINYLFRLPSRRIESGRKIDLNDALSRATGLSKDELLDR